MKKCLVLASALVLVFAISFALTLDTSAAKTCTRQVCCTITAACGTGTGSWVPTICYDPLGKPYTCVKCMIVNPTSPYYNPCCFYSPPPACKIT